MNDKGIAYDNGHRCYVLAPDGRTKRFLGCNHGDVPRAAIAHTVPVYVDPRRSPDGSHVAPVPPAARRFADPSGELRVSEAPGS